MFSVSSSFKDIKEIVKLTKTLFVSVKKAPLVWPKKILNSTIFYRNSVEWILIHNYEVFAGSRCATLSPCSATSPLPCPCMQSHVFPKVIVLIGNAINHLHTVRPVVKLVSATSLVSSCVQHRKLSPVAPDDSKVQDARSQSRHNAAVEPLAPSLIEQSVAVNNYSKQYSEPQLAATLVICCPYNFGATFEFWLHFKSCPC